MWGWIRGGLFRNRRRRRVMFSILAFAGLFLLLHFELSAIQESQGTGGDREVQTSSRHDEGGSRLINVMKSDEHVNANRGDDHQQTELLLNGDGNNVNGFAVSAARETAGKKKPPCPKTQENARFREVAKGTVVYSVWFDDRKSQPFIRILLLTFARNPLPSLTCHFESSSKQKTLISAASFYQHNENHHMRFGSFIVSCIVPQEFDSVPCSVNISLTSAADRQTDSNSIAFPVGSIERKHSTWKETNRGKYGICIPPVYGDMPVDRLIEFLEFSQILGASHFTFYDFAVTESMRNVLKHYQDKGLVSVLPWNLPPYISKYDLHYFGQPLAIMDCLYRSMKHLHFVAFNDLDEFIVPLGHDNMSALLKDIHKEHHCGHCFESVVFDPSTDKDPEKSSPLLTQRVLHRTSQATPFWSKCVVEPRKIFEQGVHHISKPIEEYYHADRVDWNVARVFHYRKCHDSRAAMQPRCSALKVDKTMQKFGDQLLRKFEKGKKAINDRKP